MKRDRLIRTVVIGLCASVGPASREQGPCLGEPITGPATTLGDEFATGVAVDGDVVVFGAPLRDKHGKKAGAVYTFRFAPDEWFGNTIDLDGGIDSRDVLTLLNASALGCDS